MGSWELFLEAHGAHGRARGTYAMLTAGQPCLPGPGLHLCPSSTADTKFLLTPPCSPPTPLKSQWPHLRLLLLQELQCGGLNAVGPQGSLDVTPCAKADGDGVDKYSRNFTSILFNIEPREFFSWKRFIKLPAHIGSQKTKTIKTKTRQVPPSSCN